MLTVGVGSYGIACAACFGIVVMRSIGRITRDYTVGLLTAALALWASLGLYSALGLGDADATYVAADVLRSAALLFVLNHALGRLKGSNDKPVRFAILFFSSALAFGLGALSWAHHPDADFWRLIGQIGLSVAGFFLIESLLTASKPDALWSTKHLLIGGGIIYAFDLFYYTDALFLPKSDSLLNNYQPIIAIFAAPFILVSAQRLEGFKIAHPVSSKISVGMRATLASGAYILSVAGIAYLIRELGWTWDPDLRLIFLFGAAMGLLVLLSWTLLRHGSRRRIEPNVFTVDYDYRREWLRLVEKMTAEEVSARSEDPSLGQRALKATAALLDADGGALFMRNAKGHLLFQTSWNIALENRAPSSPPMALMNALSLTKPALVVNRAKAMPSELGDNAEIKEWLSAFREPWIVLALIAGSEVVGLALITHPSKRRQLTQEDLNILQIFAHQLGSYLVIERRARHVAESEHFERMSNHVTFVAHDLKNVISQLSLILQRAKDYAHDPAFVSDTFLTIGDATEHMKRLMQKLQEDAGHATTQPVNLQALIDKICAEKRVDRLVLPEVAVVVDAVPTILQSLLDHLLDNAWQAVEAKGVKAEEDARRSGKAHLIVDILEAKPQRVSLTLKVDSRNAILEIADTGIGMTDIFIETELFSPVRSTNRAGFGIGMYQYKDAVERWQGQIDVASTSGDGTTITITLPLSEIQETDCSILTAVKAIEPAKEHAA